MNRKKDFLRRLLCAVLCAAMALTLLAGCRRAPEETEAPTETQTQPAPTVIVETEPETEPETEEETQPLSELEQRLLPDGRMYSYYTGLPVSVEQGSRRAVAVMINNVKAALPQAGVASAQIMYECPTEGGTVRLMGVFPDGIYDELPKIGSIRSARTYYVLLQSSLQCIFIHNGRALFALPYLEMPHIQRMDGTLGKYYKYYYRTTEKKSPHNLFISGEGINKGIADFEYDTQIPEGFDPFEFYHGDEKVNPTVAKGEDAKTIHIGFRSNDSTFVYHPDEDLYYHFQYGEKHIDQNNDKQVTTNNILIEYHTVDYYDETEYLNITLDGEGEGYYCTGGKVIPITWSRSFEWGMTHYYDLEGNEIQLTPGKTWISIIQKSRKEHTTFEP